MEIRFTKAARKRGVSRESVRYVMATSDPRQVVTAYGTSGWQYVARDQVGQELEVIAVETVTGKEQIPCILVVHVMPTSMYRGKGWRKRRRR